MRSGAALLCLTAALAGAAVSRAAGDSGTRGALSPPTAAPAAISTPIVERHSPRDGSPSLGPENAKSTLVFYTDYQCPVCPRAARELPRLVAEMNGALRVELRHHPLPMHRGALDVAAASRAAQRQGRFWEYHDLLLASEGRTDRATLISLARNLGLDEGVFLHDMDDPALRQGILDEAQEAQRLGADGTPGFMINGHVEVGWASYSWILDVVHRQMNETR